MNEQVTHLIEALREELKEYGEMLARLDHQQEMVMQRQATDLLASTASVNAQAETIAAARSEREQRQRHVARQLGLSEDAGFAVIVPLLAPAYGPLLNALVEENNSLLVRIQQRARQNHLLLSRSVELMQKLIGSMFPGTQPATYSDAGRLQAAAPAGHPLYDAIG